MSNSKEQGDFDPSVYGRPNPKPIDPDFDPYTDIDPEDPMHPMNEPKPGYRPPEK